jgi:hypothetical protein
MRSKHSGIANYSFDLTGFFEDRSKVVATLA